jgi:hypothetical protein
MNRPVLDLIREYLHLIPQMVDCVQAVAVGVVIGAVALGILAIAKVIEAFRK